MALWKGFDKMNDFVSKIINYFVLKFFEIKNTMTFVVRGWYSPGDRGGSLGARLLRTI